MTRRGIVIPVTFALFITLMIVDARQNKTISNATGAPAGHTGSPGDGFQTCMECHLGPAATFESGWIVSNIPGSGYVPGTTYSLTATATAPGHVRFGFQVTPEDFLGNEIGALQLTNATETKLVGLGKYITHTSSGTSGSNSKSWNFNWTAPTAGSGDVTFYGAFNIANNDGNNTFDSIHVSQLSLPECQVPLQPSAIAGFTNVCPSTSVTYSINPLPDASTYHWSIPSGWSGSSTDTFITVTTAANSGTISVYAENACGSGSSRSLSVTIGALSATTTGQINVTCFGGSNGSVTASPTGGAGQYTYSWNTNPVKTTATASGLAAGTYTVTVTDVAGCTATAQATITQPAVISLSSASIHPACQGSNVGSAVVSVLSGGTGPFSYSWNTTPVQNNDTALNLSSGTYTATVTDASGCTKTSSITITQAPAMTLSTNGSNVSCNGGNNGSATAQVTGGTNPITYSWNTSPVQTTATISSLTAGSYVVTSTDNVGCTKTASITITQPSVISASTTHTNVSCFAGNDGTATAVTSGGTGAFTYSWNTVPVQTTALAGGLTFGTYTVTVKDANNCTKTASATITQPTQINLQTGSTNADCSMATGSAWVVATGGNPGYTYSWNTNPVQTNDTIYNLLSGVYTVAVTDQNNCTSQTVVTVTNASGVIASVLSVTDVTCHGDSTGSASILASSGSLPYTYSWSPSGDTSASISGAIAGVYNVSVTDSNNCVASLVITIDEPPALIVSAGNDVQLCLGDTVQLGSSPTAFGGVPPYGYLWSPSTGLSSDTSENPLCHASSTTSYIVSVTDLNGCQSDSSVTVLVNPLPAVPVISKSNDTLYCSPALNCQWYENGVLINGADTNFLVPTHNADYTVSVTDTNSCSSFSAVYSFVLGLEEFELSGLSISIFPNPARGTLNIRSNRLMDDGRISIMDMNGRTRLMRDVELPEEVMDISSLPAGVYLLRVVSRDTNFSKLVFVID